MSDREYDLVSVMAVPVDLVLRLQASDWPAVGKNGLVEYLGHLPGGPPSNMSSAAARLGLKTAHVAKIRPGDTARIILDDFERTGVFTEFIQVTEDAPYAFTVVVIFPNGDRSILVPLINWTDVDMANARRAIAHARYVTTLPMFFDLFMTLAHYAQEAGCKVFVDVDQGMLNGPEQLDHLLAVSDIVSFNQHGFEMYCGGAPTFERMR
ncbi:MAG: carbohydrate kinase family protein, partial [Anaerolineae bacterium]|nr:carbohydrate kinase family protein [Anaerolineae bacterium]